MLSKKAPETDAPPSKVGTRHANARARLSPDIAELLNMLKAFETSLAAGADSSGNAPSEPIAESISASGPVTAMMLVA